ncbi:MAG: penicillin-insensitive murein endopeptidase [Myxococcales bacterium]|nr:penicillin-insensitive murein endopeptidase [Myxococcales bacterium]
MRRGLVILLLGALSILGAARASARPAVHHVKRGDTLSSIAKQHAVSVSDLEKWNHIPKGRLRPGDRVYLAPGATRIHVVKKGQTLSGIAKRSGVTTAELLELNPGISRSLKEGQEVVVPGGATRGPEPRKRSSSKRSSSKRSSSKRGHGPDDPEVVCPSDLAEVPKHVGYKRVHADASYATQRTLDALKRGFDHVQARHRLAPRVMVLDASRKDLGPVGDHRSHQEGRDIDISYYQRKCKRDGCATQAVRPDNLDVKRQWTLLSYWLRSGDVDMMFVDRGLQEVLREYAKKRGVKEDQLDEWFQYPRPAGSQEGVIRHWPGHKNHVHVRFKRPFDHNRSKKHRVCRDIEKP